MADTLEYAHPYTPLGGGGVDVWRLRTPALIAGAAGAALCILGLVLDPAQFVQSYLYGYLYWFGLPMGALGLLMLQHLTGGAWGLILRRPLEAATRTLPLMIVLFIPVFLGRHVLYPWMHEDMHFLGFKDWWLQENQWILRAILYFAIWLVLTYLLNSASAREDKTGSPRVTKWMEAVSGPGLVIFALSVTGASVDWVMSIDAHWFSTMYGFWFIIGQVLTTFSILVWLVCQLSQREPMAKLVKPVHFTDFGNLMFAFNMLWAYISFSQFLIIWQANIAEETPFYYIRTQQGWGAMALVLVIFHFAIPFVLLLNRALKRSVTLLAVVALWVAVMRLVDYYWVLMPTFEQGHDGPSLVVPPIDLSWMDFVTPIGIGGLWVAFFLWQLSRRPLIATHDPRLHELDQHHG